MNTQLKAVTVPAPAAASTNSPQTGFLVLLYHSWKIFLPSGTVACLRCMLHFPCSSPQALDWSFFQQVLAILVEKRITYRHQHELQSSALLLNHDCLLLGFSAELNTKSSFSVLFQMLLSFPFHLNELEQITSTCKCCLMWLFNTCLIELLCG